jgi:hypothetical protein
MKFKLFIEPEDISDLHDVIYDLIGEHPTPEYTLELIQQMDTVIIGTALSWGWSDTVVRDSVYTWLEQHLKEHPYEATT